MCARLGFGMLHGVTCALMIRLLLTLMTHLLEWIVQYHHGGVHIVTEKIKLVWFTSILPLSLWMEKVDISVTPPPPHNVMQTILFNCSNKICMYYNVTQPTPFPLASQWHRLSLRLGKSFFLLQKGGPFGHFNYFWRKLSNWNPTYHPEEPLVPFRGHLQILPQNNCIAVRWESGYTILS